MSDAKEETVIRLGDAVTLENGTQGRIVGICEVMDRQTSYLVRASTTNGRLYEEWWPVNAFTPGW